MYTWSEVYSDTLRKPKKATTIAAHNITLSLCFIGALKRLIPSCWMREGVIGVLFGFLYFLPSTRFIPFNRRRKRNEVGNMEEYP